MPRIYTRPSIRKTVLKSRRFFVIKCCSYLDVPQRSHCFVTLSYFTKRRNVGTNAVQVSTFHNNFGEYFCFFSRENVFSLALVNNSFHQPHVRCRPGLAGLTVTLKTNHVTAPGTLLNTQISGVRAVQS